MKTTTETRDEAEAALVALRERVIRLEDEHRTAEHAVTVASGAMSTALAAGRPAEEKAFDRYLEERDRAARRLEAAREALVRAEALAEKVALEDEAARAAATLETEAALAKEIRRDLRRALLLLGVALRAAIENDARSWEARKALQRLGGEGPIESLAIPGLMFSAFLDEVASELAAKRDNRSCDRLSVRVPY